MLYEWLETIQTKIQTKIAELYTFLESPTYITHDKNDMKDPLIVAWVFLVLLLLGIIIAVWFLTERGAI